MLETDTDSKLLLLALITYIPITGTIVILFYYNAVQTSPIYYDQRTFHNTYCIQLHYKKISVSSVIL